ncbi:hypothetical protein EDD15DRAFT_2199325 [Pisolithus albus]|nr:hypothetical protein EDD15DRAFT_2199325 [Pisolithus albus]
MPSDQRDAGRRSRWFAAILHSVDWVHHDISACNVLRSGKIGKIDGLECAKHMDYKTTHKVATVMLDFVACEVGVQDYLCPFRFNPLHDMESVWWIACRPLSEQVRVISIFSSSAKRQLEDPAPEDRDPKQPKDIHEDQERRGKVDLLRARNPPR